MRKRRRITDNWRVARKLKRREGEGILNGSMGGTRGLVERKGKKGRWRERRNGCPR